MDAHRLAEERSLAYHRAIAARLAGEPGLRERARARARRWLETGEVHPEYARAWVEALELSLEELAEALADPGERARALRQVSPFAGALAPRERWRLWRAVGREARGDP